MKQNQLIALRVSELILKQLLLDSNLTLQTDQKNLRLVIEQEILKNFQTEQSIIDLAGSMMDDLESQGQKFERYKMLPLLKNQLAKKQGFVL